MEARHAEMCISTHALVCTHSHAQTRMDANTHGHAQTHVHTVLESAFLSDSSFGPRELMLNAHTLMLRQQSSCWAKK